MNLSGFMDVYGIYHASSDAPSPAMPAARFSVAMAPRSGSPFASPRPLRSPRTAEKAPLENRPVFPSTHQISGHPTTRLEWRFTRFVILIKLIDKLNICFCILPQTSPK